MTAARWATALIAWGVQYLFAVWLIVAWRLGLSAFLLCIPIVGWLVLWVRHRDRRRDELLSAVRGEPRRSIWRPWLLDWARS